MAPERRGARPLDSQRQVSGRGQSVGRYTAEPVPRCDAQRPHPARRQPTAAHDQGTLLRVTAQAPNRPPPRALRPLAGRRRRLRAAHPPRCRSLRAPAVRGNPRRRYFRLPLAWRRGAARPSPHVRAARRGRPRGARSAPDAGDEGTSASVAVAPLAPRGQAPRATRRMRCRADSRSGRHVCVVA